VNTWEVFRHVLLCTFQSTRRQWLLAGTDTDRHAPSPHSSEGDNICRSI